MLKFNGSPFPSIYQTARGDFYCTYRRKNIYLGRDPERARTKLLTILSEDEGTEQTDGQDNRSPATGSRSATRPAPVPIER